MKKVLFLILTAAVVCSCSVYHPQMADVPLIAHQGDGHAELSASVDWMGVPTAIESNLSVSYGVTDWVAVQAAGSTDLEKGAYGQAAVGIYKTFGSAVVELYGGYGSGYCYSDDSHKDQSWRQNGNYQVGYGQLDFGWVGLLDGHLDIGIGLKGGMVYPDVTMWKQKVDENGDSYMARETDYKEQHYLIEPQLMLRTGGQHLKASFRLGFCDLTPVKEGSELMPYVPLSVAVGVNYRF